MSPAAPLTRCNRKGPPSESWECWGLLQMAGYLMGRPERSRNVFGDHDMGKLSFSSCFSSYEELLTTRSIFKKNTEPNRSLWGYVFPSLWRRERMRQKWKGLCSRLLWKQWNRMADGLLCGYTNIVPPSAPSCIWMILRTVPPREIS